VSLLAAKKNTSKTAASIYTLNVIIIYLFIRNKYIKHISKTSEQDNKALRIVL